MIARSSRAMTIGGWAMTTNPVIRRPLSVIRRLDRRINDAGGAGGDGGRENCSDGYTGSTSAINLSKNKKHGGFYKFLMREP